MMRLIRNIFIFLAVGRRCSAPPRTTIHRASIGNAPSARRMATVTAMTGTTTAPRRP